MSQEKIPDNNLPFYIQNYNVNIVNGEEVAGKVLYTTVGSIPSTNPLKPVWQLNLTGYLKPNVDKYSIIYDFSESNYRYKNTVTFENIASGTFNLCGHVLDASKIIGFNYTYSDADSKLTIELDTKKWDFQLKKESLFSYQLNLDDNTNTFTLGKTPVLASASQKNWVIDGKSYNSITAASNVTVQCSQGRDNEKYKVEISYSFSPNAQSISYSISIPSHSISNPFLPLECIRVDDQPAPPVKIEVTKFTEAVVVNEVAIVASKFDATNNTFDATFYPIAYPNNSIYKLTSSSSLTVQGNVTSPYGWTINDTNYSSIQYDSKSDDGFSTFYSIFPLTINSNFVGIAVSSDIEEVFFPKSDPKYYELVSLELNDSKNFPPYYQANLLTITITEIDVPNKTFTATFKST